MGFWDVLLLYFKLEAAVGVKELHFVDAVVCNVDVRLFTMTSMSPAGLASLAGGFLHHATIRTLHEAT